MEEEQLWIQQVLAGDKEAYANIINKYKNQLYATVLRMTRNPQDAQDFVQDAFIKVYRNLDKYKADGSSYNLEKEGPRILVGEDGVRYSSRIYLDTLETVTDDITPERLKVASQNEHTFLIEWGLDSMDRGNHDFESHEHGQLVVSTDFDEFKRGQAVYYHMPSSVLAKNTEVPDMYIGRVVGLPGETVEIKGGKVYIDGKMLDTFYGKATRRGLGEKEYFELTPSNAIVDAQSTRDYFNMDMEAVSVKKDTVFILVDQWWRGYDSREYGPLPIEKIEGIITGTAE